MFTILAIIGAAWLLLAIVRAAPVLLWLTVIAACGLFLAYMTLKQLHFLF